MQMPSGNNRYSHNMNVQIDICILTSRIKN